MICISFKIIPNKCSNILHFWLVLHNFFKEYKKNEVNKHMKLVLI